MDGENSLEIETLPRAEPPGKALERFRQVSLALSDAARRKRLSSRLRAGGAETRRGSRATRRLLLASFLLMVVAPSLAAAVYFGLIAADQFVSEAEFTLSASSPVVSQSKDDSVGSSSNLPMLMIIQDTQVVVNFVHSRAALDKLQERVQVRDLYSDPRADWFARFNPEKPIERFVKYWTKMSDAYIEMPGGIVHLRVRAFTASAAQRIAAAMVDICEQLVNDMNARINNDSVVSAEQALNRASERLASALTALQLARNESGIVETTKSAEAIGSLLKEAKLQLLGLQEQYDVHLKDVSPSAPQMLQLNSRIQVTRKQIADIEAKLTSSEGGAEGTIAQAMTKFGALDLQRKVAEDLYSAAAAGLEVARLNAEDKLMYLKTFVAPEVPEEAEFPRRWINSGLVLLGSLAIWGILCAFAGTFRNHMA